MVIVTFEELCQTAVQMTNFLIKLFPVPTMFCSALCCHCYLLVTIVTVATLQS